MASVWNKGLNISVFGESHGKAVGVVIDSFPHGVLIDIEDLKKFMARRTRNYCKFNLNLRRELDCFEIISGLFNGKTTGSPICCIIHNRDVDSRHYEFFKNYARPGHCDHTLKLRYGGFNDYRGGGHFSGRLTAPVVFAGAVCSQILKSKNIKIFSHVYSIGKVKDISFLNFGLDLNFSDFENLKEKLPLEVFDDFALEKMEAELEQTFLAKDSVGGIVECGIFGLPAGIGSPIFDGLENYISCLAFAIPGVKGIEFGNGFEASFKRGSENNDELYFENGVLNSKTNNCGGIAGGISSGAPVIFKVAFKPTPTIFKEQNTVNLNKLTNVRVTFNGRHDVCIAARGCCCVEAIANIAVTSQLIYQGKI